MTAFEELFSAARFAHDKFRFLLLVFELSDKRQHVAMYRHDMPGLVKSFVDAVPTHRVSTQVVKIDPLPGLRLAAACEGLANTVYSACEVAASFACKASNGKVSSSFNAYRNNVKKGTHDGSLVGGLGNFEWYERIREIRTEWTHHSTIFIGVKDGSPVLVVKPLRRQKDRIQLPEKTLVSVDDLIAWSGRAIIVLDCFALEVYKRFVLPGIDLDLHVYEPVMNRDGFPIMRPDGGMETRRITIRECLRCVGFDV